VDITLLASGTHFIWRLLESYGYDPEPVFLDCGIDTKAIKEPENRIAYAVMSRVWNIAVEKVKDPCIGLRVARYWHPSDMNALGHAWIASRNLQESFERLARYIRCLTDAAEIKIEDNADRFNVIYVNKINPEVSYTLIDAVMTIMIKMSRLNYGDHLEPQEVRLRHPAPACSDKYELLFNSKVIFNSPENALCFSRADFKKPLLSSNPYLAEMNDQILIKYMAKLDKENLVSQTKTKILDMLPSGKVTDDKVARELFTSVRTLQRHLKKKGTTFQTILNETRKDLAVQYIKEPGIRLEEIPFLMGFTDYSVFSKAFKKWTGYAPSEFYASGSRV
jgi:AraC-like DNA-binding protein